MGVAGCGKSTIGNALADQMNGVYLEGDSFHPEQNIEKMSRGEPLNDEDRWPWLKVIALEMAKTDGIIFTGCSALKKSYRNYLSQEAGEMITFVHLQGSKDVIMKRMSSRPGHFMPASLLESQFATLEPLGDDEYSFIVDIEMPMQTIIEKITMAISKNGLEKRNVL